MVYVLPVPEWVRHSAIAVADLSWLAHRQFLLADDAYDRAQADGMQLALDWVQGSLELGPATGRYPCPCTRAVAEAELWAAMALADGGGTTERDMRHACTSPSSSSPSRVIQPPGPVSST